MRVSIDVLVPIMKPNRFPHLEKQRTGRSSSRLGSSHSLNFGISGSEGVGEEGYASAL
jgi:hypothetical protein